MVFQIILHDHQIETIRTSSLARRNWLTTCSSWTKTMRLTISISSGRWEDYMYHQDQCFVQNSWGHCIDWLESLCLNHYDVDKRQKILVSSSVHGIAHLYDQCCFQGTHTHTHDVSRVRGSLSTPDSSAECVLWCITHRFVLINMILVSWFSSSSSRSVGSHHHYLGHHLNDFKSYFSFFGHTPHLRVFGPCP